MVVFLDNMSGSASVEHEKKLKRQATPHDNCTLTWVALKEEGLGLFADSQTARTKAFCAWSASTRKPYSPPRPPQVKTPTDTHTTPCILLHFLKSSPSSLALRWAVDVELAVLLLCWLCLVWSEVLCQCCAVSVLCCVVSCRVVCGVVVVVGVALLPLTLPFDGDVSETKVHAPTKHILWLLVVVSVVDGGGCE